MGRVLLAVFAALALLIAGLAVLVFVDREDERQVAVDNLLAEEISLEVNRANTSGEPFDLAASTDFAWKRVIIADEKATKEQLSEALGSEFEGKLNYDVESSAVLLFAVGDELVRWTDYRGRGQFVGLEQPTAELSRDEAVFDVEGLKIRPVAEAAGD